MSYFTGTVTVTNAGPSVIVANDTVDRMVYLAANTNIAIGFTSGTCVSLIGSSGFSFLLPASQDLYGSTSFSSESTSVLVAKVPGASSFAATVTGTIS